MSKPKHKPLTTTPQLTILKLLRRSFLGLESLLFDTLLEPLIVLTGFNSDAALMPVHSSDSVLTTFLSFICEITFESTHAVRLSTLRPSSTP